MSRPILIIVPLLLLAALAEAGGPGEWPRYGMNYMEVDRIRDAMS